MREFDPARYLDSETAIEEYLLATCEDGAPAEIARAWRRRARERSPISRSRPALTRQALYKPLSGEGNPELATIAKGWRKRSASA
jgi:probable addiction module antidote protein